VLYLVVLYVMLPAAQIFFFMQNLLLWDTPELLNYFCAIACYHWMLANIVISVKLPILQNRFPYDSRIRFHIIGTIGIGATLLYHAFYKIAIGKNIDLVSWSLLGLFLVLVFFGILWIPLPILKKIRAKVLSLKNVILFGSYDIMKRFHIGLFVTLSILMFYHVILANLFFMVPDYSAWIYTICFACTILLYAYTKLRNRFLPRFIVTGVEESDKLITLRLSGELKLKYRPGQFAFIRFDRKEYKGEEHPFSFLSIPGEDGVSFGIKVCGDFTEKLKALRIGDTARVNAGFGAFRPQNHDGKRGLCFIGSGIGSIPFISLLKQMHADKDRRAVHFFLAVDTERGIPEYESLLQRTGEMPNCNMHLLVWEREKTLYSYEYFKKQIPRPTEFEYYICSSENVRNKVQNSLVRLGVKKKDIHSESFTFG
jgi:predicted ferric reductase